jgi:hypothetical protein
MGLFGAVGAGDLDDALAFLTGDADAPWVATDFAILDEAAFDVRLDVDLDVFAAVRTGDCPRVVQP